MLPSSQLLLTLNFENKDNVYLATLSMRQFNSVQYKVSLFIYKRHFIVSLHRQRDCLSAQYTRQ